MTPPKGTYIRIAPRSGLAFRKKIQIDAGVIDPNYTGEIKVLLSNRNTKPCQVNQGDKFAQIILGRADKAKIKLVSALQTSDRGSKGFGSSDKTETNKNQAQTNICDSNHKTSKIQKIQHQMDKSKLNVLPKIME